jgi:hypothetical protein
MVNAGKAELHKTQSPAPVVHASPLPSDANLPKPEECWTHSKKAARPSRLVTAFSLWCALRDEVLTAIWQDVDALIGIGSSVQRLREVSYF